jgi:N-acetylneuraminate epimerase
MRRRTLLAGSAAAAGLVALPETAATAGSSLPETAGPLSHWTALPDLPANTVDWHPDIPVGEPYWTQLGLAGPIAGAHGNYLLAGGGANFPEPALTSNRANKLGKVYWNELFVLRSGRWADPIALPDALGYPACVSTPYGVLVIGGEGFRGGPNGTALAPVQKFADVFLLRYDGRLVREDLPSLPRPMSYAVAGLVGSTVYVAEGGDFLSLDLEHRSRGWTALPPWPGDPRTVAVGAASSGRFYLISGRGQLADKSWRFYTDAYAYDPRRSAWSRLADLPGCVTAGLAHPAPGGLLVLGGDRRIDRWNLIQQQTALRDSFPKGSPGWNDHNDVITWIYDHHTGFNRDILRYDAASDRWTVVGHFPGASQVTTPAVPWEGGLAVISGEIRPGVRTPSAWHLR